MESSMPDGVDTSMMDANELAIQGDNASSRVAAKCVRLVHEEVSIPRQLHRMALQDAEREVVDFGQLRTNADTERAHAEANSAQVRRGASPQGEVSDIQMVPQDCQVVWPSVKMSDLQRPHDGPLVINDGHVHLDHGPHHDSLGEVVRCRDSLTRRTEHASPDATAIIDNCEARHVHEVQRLCRHDTVEIRWHTYTASTVSSRRRLPMML